MSKHWNPPRHTAKLRPPSRIRRDPLLVPALPAPQKKANWNSTEWERRLAIAGIVAFALAMAFLTLGFSAMTAGFGSAAPVVDEQRFGSCKNEAGPNCVFDGDTIRLAGEQVNIAGMYAPKVETARCGAEEQRGAKAVERLLQLLNSGKVTKSESVRDADGQVRARVLVDGRDVAAVMIAAGLARPDDGERHGWCES